MVEIDLENGLRRWLEDGPTVPPDRLIERAIGHAVAHPRRAASPGFHWRAFDRVFSLPRVAVPVARVAVLLLTLTLALALAAIAFVGSQNRANLPVAESRLIAFTYAGDIWTVSADGSAQARPLAAVKSLDEVAPAWSPDGKRLALWAIVPGSLGDQEYRIEVVGADGGGRRTIDSAVAVHIGMPDAGEEGAWRPFRTPDASRTRHVSWSPDGRSIAYAINWDVRVTDVESGATRRLFPDGLGEMPVFSPDGSRVAFFGQSADAPVGGLFLYMVGATGSGLDRLPMDGDPYPVYPVSPPTWTGNDIIVDTEVAGGGLPSLHHFAGDGLSHESIGPVPAVLPVISPDGLWVSFLRLPLAPDPAGRWVMKSSGADLHLEVAGAYRLAWSADGKTVAFDVRESCDRGYLQTCVSGLATAPSDGTVDLAKTLRLWTLPTGTPLENDPWMDIAWQPAVR